VSRLLSGSGVAIAAECGWAYHADSEYTEAPRDEEATEGQEVHDGIAMRLTPGAEYKALRPELAAKVQQALAWLAEEKIAVLGVERAFAYKPSDKSVRVLGDNIDRKYEEHGLDPATEIPFSVDLVGRRADGTYVVVDWKNEFLQGHLEPAADSLQLGLAAHALARTMSARQVDVVYAFIAPDQVSAEWASHNGLSLLRVLGRTEQAWLNSKRRRLPVQGAHCRYCPALGACPETRAQFGNIAEEQLPDVPKGIVWSTEYVSDENDALLAMNGTAMEKAVERIRAALKERARARGGIDLPNGKFYGLNVSSRSTFNKKKAEELLGDRFAECVGRIEVESFIQMKRK
jgi:hypothetical protein